MALGLAIAGPGVYSVDASLGIALPQPATLIVGLAAALIGVWIAASMSAAARRQKAAQPEPRAATAGRLNGSPREPEPQGVQND